MKLSLPSSVHQLAKGFASEQLTIDKGRSVYLNTLAVHTVSRYLTLCGIKTDLQQGDWRDPVTHTLQDISDLVIPNIGRIECRAILPGASRMAIPSFAPQDVVGYVAVQFDEELKSVDLLGFFPSHELMAEQEQISLQELLPLEEIFAYLDPVTRLSIAFQRGGLKVWRRLHDFSQDLTESLQQALSQHFRPAFQVRSNNPSELLSDNAIAQPLPIGSNLVLVIDRTVQDNALPGEEISVCVIVCSDNGDYGLPADLQMTISSGDNSQMNPVTPGVPVVIQSFTGTEGEPFQVLITSNGDEYTESFEI
jgi:hypothetical protein